MNIQSKLESARSEYLKCCDASSRTEELRMAWNAGALAVLNIAMEWSRNERIRIEALHSHDSRRGS